MLKNRRFPVFVALSALLFAGCARQESAELVEKFEPNRAALDQLVTMFNEDVGLTRVSLEGTEPADPSDVDIDPDRIEAYRNLCRQIGAQGCIEGFEPEVAEEDATETAPEEPVFPDIPETPEPSPDTAATAQAATTPAAAPGAAEGAATESEAQTTEAAEEPAEEESSEESEETAAEEAEEPDTKQFVWVHMEERGANQRGYRRGYFYSLSPPFDVVADIDELRPRNSGTWLQRLDGPWFIYLDYRE
jgi:FtsZ-interacting cell division protein ZipA